MKYLLMLMTMSTIVQACPNYSRLEMGQQAPCSGYFFNDVSEKKIRDEVYRSGLRAKELELKDLQIGALMTDSESWKKEAKRQAEIVQDKKNDTAHGVLMGVGGTLLTFFLLNKVLK